MSKKSKIVFVGIILLGLIFIVVYNLINYSKEMKIINDILEDAKSSSTEVMVYIGSSECVACEYQGPEMSLLLDNYDFTYYYIDMASIPTTSEISKFIEKTGFDTTDTDFSTPSIFIYKDGKIINQLVGLSSVNKIFNMLQKNNIIEESATLPINYLNFSNYANVIDSEETTILALGSSSIEDSLSMETIMWELANQYNLNINFLQLYDLSEEEGATFEKSLDYFESNGLTVPSVLIIKDGEVIDSLTSLVDNEDYIAFFQEHDMINTEGEDNG